ncbi:PR domain zinc finger protein 10-like isoform X2 [Neocloeon triangulifer]|uniref:PR domain zinc finger protein 10-like isoform X2 n=1 Tax=Neocloeon triangulifer TaxID=2078957 RepID=UPI00286EB645|nr:PR domain zinc finger protein 10-like isoform X2 [Neocloeon triangulifer]
MEGTPEEPPDESKVEDWTTASSSHLEQVEFVEGGEQFTSFPEQPTGDFDHEVSPLDPNMSSVACYSPVYPKTMQFYPQTSDICVSSSTGSVDEQQAMVFLDEKKIVMDAKVDSSGDEELQDVQRLIASAAQSYLANGGIALEQLLSALRNRSDRNVDDKEKSLELIMEEELIKEMAEEVDKQQEWSEKEEHKVISDKPVPSRAWASLPNSFLSIGKLSKAPGFGIFARKSIPKKTQFGPLEGALVQRDDANVMYQGLELSVELENGLFAYFDTSNENLSNWMRFVRPAKIYEEMNVVVVQIKDTLCFITTQVIQPKQELLVGYSEQYASARQLSVLHPTNVVEDNAENACYHCDKLFTSSERLKEHMIHHQEKGAAVKRKVLSHLPIKKCKSDDNSSGEETTEFRCNTCSRNFPRSYSLKRHLLLHSPDKNSKKILREKSERSVLKQKNQSKDNLWTCSYCQLSFETASMLNLHTLAHAAENVEEQEAAEVEKQKCPQCCQQYGTKRELVEHIAAHGKNVLRRRTVNPEKPHKCELCYKSFATDDRLQKHMLVHGAEETKPLQCEVCFKRFLNNSALACHVKVHTEEKKMFECPICRAVFEQVIALKEHVHTHCSNGMYTCPHCSKTFDEYNQIRKHIRAFHSEKRFPCCLCDKVFPRPDKLKLHMLRHSDHREFLCANCGKQFKRKDKLKEHMKRMHSSEREAKQQQKPNRQSISRKFIPKVSPTDYQRFLYKCHQCMLGFKRRGMLVNHLAKRHPSISPDSVPELNLPILKTTRDYFCQYCEKVYKSSSKRKAHILKNHPGSELPMSNRRKGGVPEIPGVPNPTYSQTVGSVTTLPHGCTWCHKQYASKAKLLQHQRKKHTDLVVSKEHAQNMPLSNTASSESSSDSDPKPTSKFLMSGESLDVIQIQEDSGNLISAVNLLPTNARIEYQVGIEDETMPEGRIYIDASVLKQPLKAAGTDMLSQALLSSDLSLSDEYVKVYHAGNVVVANGVADEERLVAVTTAQIETSQLRQLLQLGGGESGREWTAYPAR